MLVCLWLGGFTIFSLLIRYCPGASCCPMIVRKIRGTWYWVYLLVQISFGLREVAQVYWILPHL